MLRSLNLDELELALQLRSLFVSNRFGCKILVVSWEFARVELDDLVKWLLRAIHSFANLSDSLVPGGLARRLVEQLGEGDVKVIRFRVDLAAKQFSPGFDELFGRNGRECFVADPFAISGHEGVTLVFEENFFSLLGSRHSELQLDGVRGHEKSFKDNVLCMRRLS